MLICRVTGGIWCIKNGYIYHFHVSFWPQISFWVLSDEYQCARVSLNFFGYIYHFHVFFWPQISFSQFPKIDLVQFFITFFRWEFRCTIAYTHTLDLVNLPCPKFADLAFLRIWRILIQRSWSHVIGKSKTASYYQTITGGQSGRSTWILITL